MVGLDRPVRLYTFRLGYISALVLALMLGNKANLLLRIFPAFRVAKWCIALRLDWLTTVQAVETSRARTALFRDAIGKKTFSILPNTSAEYIGVRLVCNTIDGVLHNNHHTANFSCPSAGQLNVCICEAEINWQTEAEMLHNMAKKDVFFPLPRAYSGFTHAMLKRPNTRQSSVLTAHFVAFLWFPL